MEEVARLGTEGLGYPHVLVDAYGWCLRLGPTPRTDDRFYSRVTTLLEGLVEHLIRRRLTNGPTLHSAQSMLTEVQLALDEARRCRDDLYATVGTPAQDRPSVFSPRLV